jgi:plasmid maintenance system antidote protein VapI
MASTSRRAASTDTIPMGKNSDTSQMTKPVGDVIIGGIRERGITIAAFARQTAVRYDILSAVIHHREKLSIPVALKIAPALGMEPDDLLVMQLKQKIEAERKRLRCATIRRDTKGT